MARVSVHVTAIHPETGDVLARSATHVMAYRDAQEVLTLVRDSSARALTATDVVRGEFIEDDVVGREVLP